MVIPLVLLKWTQGVTRFQVSKCLFTVVGWLSSDLEQWVGLIQGRHAVQWQEPTDSLPIGSIPQWLSASSLSLSSRNDFPISSSPPPPSVIHSQSFTSYSGPPSLLLLGFEHDLSLMEHRLRRLTKPQRQEASLSTSCSKPFLNGITVHHSHFRRNQRHTLLFSEASANSLGLDWRENISSVDSWKMKLLCT